MEMVQERRYPLPLRALGSPHAQAIASAATETPEHERRALLALPPPTVRAVAPTLALPPARPCPAPPRAPPAPPLVPYSSIRRVRNLPSRPVMPWTGRREFLSPRILMTSLLGDFRSLGGLRKSHSFASSRRILAATSPMAAVSLT